MATATVWSADGVLRNDSIYVGFGSLEEAFAYLDAAGCSLAEVLDYRCLGASSSPQ